MHWGQAGRSEPRTALSHQAGIYKPTVCPEHATNHVSSKAKSGLGLLLSGGTVTKAQAGHHWLRNEWARSRQGKTLSHGGDAEEALQGAWSDIPQPHRATVLKLAASHWW